MNLLHIKLKNGEDILAQEDIVNVENGVSVTAPISLHLDPVNGFFAKSWISLSDTNSVLINFDDIMFCYPASEMGVKYYEEFVRTTMGESDVDVPLEDVDELEEMFEAMLESKVSKLH